MALEIFKLVGSIFVDSDKANESIAKTDEKAEGLGKKMLKGVGTAAKWGAGLVTAAGAVGTAMIASAKGTAANMDVIDKASQRMGVSAENYQELAHAAELCGVEMTTMEKAAKKLEGTDLSFDEAMNQIWALTDAEERSAKAAELFGDTVAYQMSPMLNASAEEMEAMKKEAHDLGLVMSEDTVKAGAEMNDQFSKIESAMGAVKNEIGAALMPVVSQLLDWVIQHMPEIQEFVGNAINFVKEGIKELEPLIEKLAPIVKGVFDVIGKLWDTYLKPILNGILDFLDGVFTGNWEKIFSGLASIVKNLFMALVELVKMPINGIIGLLNKAIEGFNKIQIPDWVPLVGGKGLNIPTIPKLANGGNITRAGTVLVGEVGPELLTLPEGARVTPLNKTGDGIDYEKLEAILMKIIAMRGMEVVKIVPDESGIFKAVRQQARTYEEMTGNPAF